MTPRAFQSLGLAPARRSRRGQAWAHAVWLAAWLGLSAAASPPRVVRHWQIADGLPQNSVTTLCQTRDGYLWVGTLAGLARFDGARFVVFDPDNSPDLPNGRVTALHEDAAGALWIGHETGDVTRLEQGRFIRVAPPPGWNHDVVTSFASDAQGDVWLHSRMGRLARLRDGLTIAPGEGEIDSLGVSALARASDGGLWLTRGGLLHELREGRPVAAPQEAASRLAFVQTLGARHAGGLWAVRGGQVFAVVDGVWQPVAGAPAGLFTATRVRETRDGGLAIGTIDHGLWLVSPEGTAQNWNRTNGLSANWVGESLEDREGNLWLASPSGGLNVLRAATFESWSPPDRWHGMPVLSVTRGLDDAVWIGTEGSGLYRLRDGAWTRHATNLPNKFVWSVAVDAGGRVWAGTWGGGLLWQEGEGFATPPGMEPFKMPMTSLLHAPDGVTWVGTRAGLLRYQDGRAAFIGPRDEPARQDVRAIARDAEGTIWFGMMGGGLGRWSNGVTRVFRVADGLPSDFITLLRMDGGGALWIGTSGGGLCRWKDGRFATLGVRQGLPSSIVLNLQTDALGDAWLGTSKGIFRVAEAELHACLDGQLGRLSGFAYGTQDGLETTESSGGFQPAGCQTADGRLWFPTRKGLVSIRPGETRGTPFPPPMVIEEVWADGRKLWGRIGGATADGGAVAALTVPPGVQRFEVAYTGLGLSHPERLRFRYRLAGLDANWIEADAQRRVAYTHPPPGDYTFQVQGTDYAGHWVDPGAALRLTVPPFFWQTWWFRALAYFAGAAAVAGGVGLGVRQRQRKKLVELQRQQALERERARIARDIHDDLGASLTHISMLSQPGEAERRSPEQPLRRLEQIYGTTRELIRAVDEIVWAVNPHHDTLDSVATYLSRFAQAQLTPAGLRCRLDLPIEVPPRRVGAEARHQLFLAFKEALHNVVKHARASEARVSLAVGDGHAEFALADDGVGLAGSAGERAEGDRLASGLGTENMHRRLESVGGRCEVAAGEPRGTVVRLRIPVDERGNDE